MDEALDKLKLIEDEFDLENLADFSAGEIAVSNILENASSEGVATQLGSQTNSLQFAIDNYAQALN
ncbi:MAG: hypothetical protein K2P66_06775 [Lachnospiraceae bacterium]|nr:hypothetical protein [Lachnospiraceae bacterium]